MDEIAANNLIAFKGFTELAVDRSVNGDTDAASDSFKLKSFRNAEEPADQVQGRDQRISQQESGPAEVGFGGSQRGKAWSQWQLEAGLASGN